MEKQSFNSGWYVGKKARFFGMEDAAEVYPVTLPHDAMIEQPRNIPCRS